MAVDAVAVIGVDFALRSLRAQMGSGQLPERGYYYDAATKQGFGWDKAYWKHGIVNVNVFKDLIAHSRPVSNDNGTLVYDVPIKRTHCTKGPFGFIDCQDTGESVTMRIVANINEPRPDVPDGGQKGVITMYPLPGAAEWLKWSRAGR